MMISKESKPKFIDLFAGCGGMTLGLKRAGFELFGFVEYWKPALMTHKINFTEGKHLGNDIREITDNQISEWKNENIRLICGGPPCQGFSIAGKRDPNDPRNSLFMYFLKFINIIRPTYFVMENVPGLYSMKNNNGEYVFNIIINEIKKIGYKVEARILNTVNYGIPQIRKRIIFIGSEKMDIVFPKKEIEPERRYITVNESIGDLGNKMINKVQHIWIKKIDKKNILTKKGLTMEKFKSTGKRLYGNRPSFTLTKSGRYYHPKYGRYISIREAARLQSFPDDFIFCGSIEDMYGQIGNSVPPILAKRIGETLIKKLNE